jgi:transcriptional regulator with PAS, ATPase and Fis domain
MLDDNYSIRFKDLPRKIQSCNQSKCIRSLEEVMKEKEYDYIKNSLEIYGETVEGKKKAAKALDISLASLYNKLKDNSNNLEKQ